MKRLLGTLQVWLDTDETRIPSCMQQHSPQDWKLEMHPTADKINTRSTSIDPTSRQGFQTIMAHEMGHFIAQVTLDPVSKLSRESFYHLPNGVKTPNPANALPEERLAWQFARIIYPNLDPKIEQYALLGYERGAELQRKMEAREARGYHFWQQLTEDQREALASYMAAHPSAIHNDAPPMDVELTEVSAGLTAHGDDGISAWENEGGASYWTLPPLPPSIPAPLPPMPTCPPPRAFMSTQEVAFYNAHKDDSRYWDQPSKWSKYRTLTVYLRKHPIAHVAFGVVILCLAVFMRDKTIAIAAVFAKSLEVGCDVVFDRMFD